MARLISRRAMYVRNTINAMLLTITSTNSVICCHNGLLSEPSHALVMLLVRLPT